MAQQKRLSYLAGLSVLGQMDFITRKQLVSRVPALQTFDDSLPSRIKYLKLSPYSVSIDKTSYSYGTICKLPDGRQQVHRRRYNEEGGVRYDMNQYGHREEDGELIEGDINIEDRTDDFRPIIMQDIMAGNDGADVFERMRLEAGVFHIDARDHAREFINDADFGLGYVLHDIYLERRIVHCSATGEETRYVHINRNRKIRDVLRHQIQKLLGQDRIHQIEHLEIGTDFGVLRLPRGLIFKAKRLTCMENSNSTISRILPIIHESCRPLHCLSVKLCSKRDNVFQNQALTLAEKLIIQMPANLYGFWAQTLIELPNRVIHLENRDVPLEDLVAIAEDWIEKSKDVGTKFSMVSSDSAEFAIDAFEARLQTTRMFLTSRQCDCASRQLSATSELIVYGYEGPNFEEEYAKEEGGIPWVVVMEIVPFRSMVNIIN